MNPTTKRSIFLLVTVFCLDLSWRTSKNNRGLLDWIFSTTVIKIKAYCSYIKTEGVIIFCKILHNKYFFFIQNIMHDVMLRDRVRLENAIFFIYVQIFFWKSNECWNLLRLFLSAFVLFCIWVTDSASRISPISSDRGTICRVCMFRAWSLLEFMMSARIIVFCFVC